MDWQPASVAIDFLLLAHAHALEGKPAWATGCSQVTVLAGSPGEGDAVAGITDKANQLCTSIEGDEVQDPQAGLRTGPPPQHSLGLSCDFVAAAKPPC